MYNATKVKASSVGAFQGDVAIVRVDTLPDGAIPRPSHILAEGEATGHHHILDQEVDVFEVGRDIYFTVVPSAEDVGLRHQEHGAIILEHGATYRFVGQTEYDGEDERRVSD